MVLSFAIWLPTFSGVLVPASGSDRSPGYVRWMPLTGSVISFVVTLPLITRFDKTTAAMQLAEKSSWIERFHISYCLGIGGISMWFVMLTMFITVIVVVSAWEVIIARVAQYMAVFLILLGLMIGVFVSLNGLLFYVFFEATLIPMYVIVGMWNGPNRIYAAFRFFPYMLLGSLPALVMLLYLYFHSDMFEILWWYQIKLSMNEQILIFLAFFMAFAMKVPVWLVYTWLSGARVEAPTGGLVALAAIVPKLDAYGLLRLSLPIVPGASHSLSAFIIVVSLITVVYIGLVALAQADMKELIAYSSIAHMGFVMLGFFIFNEIGAKGGIVQMTLHGLTSDAMFLCIGVLYDRVHSRQITDYSGVANTIPKFVTLLVFFTMVNCDLPATLGFVGELMVILGSVKSNLWVGLLATTVLIFGAAYSLWVVKRVVFDDVTHKHVTELRDLNCREFFMLGALAIATLYMGLYPKPSIGVMYASVVNLLTHVTRSKL